MRGLDPRIHQKMHPFKRMDCRVKPGNDRLEGSPLLALLVGSWAKA
jgi:hypothetical protein